MLNRPFISYTSDLYYLIWDIIVKMGIHGEAIWKTVGILFVFVLMFLTCVNLYKEKIKNKYINYILSEKTYLFSIIIGVIILRLPNLIFPQLNTDESQWIVSAATLIKDPRFWLSVDGTTSGPLNIFPLTLIYVIGGTLNYATVRLFGLIVCIIPSIILLYKAFINVFDAKIARIVTLPLIICTAFINFWDIIPFNSEHIPMLMISICIFFLSKLWNKDNSKIIFLLGLFLGLTFYSKLQAVPMVLTIGFSFIFFKFRLKQLIIFLLSGLLPSCLVLIYLKLFGAFYDFWQIYILSNVFYAERNSLNIIEKIKIFLNIINTTPDTILFFKLQFLILVLTITLLIPLYKQLKIKHIQILITAFLLTLTSVYGIIKPGNGFYHYQILLFIPLTFFTGSVIGLIYSLYLENKDKLVLSHFKHILIAIILILSFIPGISNVLKGSAGIKYVENAAGIPAQQSEITKKILEYTKPNDTMSIWGWMNNYYVETGLIQGTKEPATNYQISKIKQQDYYLKRYVSDLTKNRPKIFLDVVGGQSFAYNNKETQRHELFPEVNAVIQKNYEFIADINEIRIYLLKSQ